MGNCTSQPTVDTSKSKSSHHRNSSNNADQLVHNGIGNGNRNRSNSFSKSAGKSKSKSSASKQLSKQDKIKWNIIFNEGNQGMNIVDPEDIHTILNSAISNTINNLQSAEMTLILRRVRKVIGTFSKNVQNLPKSLKKNSADAKYQKSISVYQKDHLLDLNVMRNVFIAGDRWLSRGREEDWITKSLEAFLNRGENKLNGSSSSSGHGNGHGHGHGVGNNKIKSTQEGKYSGNTYGNGSTNNSAHSNNNSNGATKHKSSPPREGDLIGSAYTLLLHLSEDRWDHIQAIAKESAERANIALDVNEQIKLKQAQQPPVHANGSPPNPTPQNPYFEYDMAPPSNPSGVSLQALSYLIAIALRSNRKQRLILLFHLLLGSNKLETLLRNHPAGGIPSFLLECDGDSSGSGSGNGGENWNLSYASLSHDFHYKDTVQVDAMTAIETVGILLHCAPPNSGVDGVASSANGENGHSPSNKNRSVGNRKRALSYGEKKYNAAKMHVMLSDYLRQVRSGNDVPVFENEEEQAWRKGLLDSFWEESMPYFTSREGGSDHGRGNEDSYSLSWTLEDFVSWADKAISNDAALDIIMHEVFGMGLLPTPAMERKLVADSWIDWQVREMIRSDEGGSIAEVSDAFSVVTSGIINLLSFSSRESGDSVSQSNSSAYLSEANYDMDGSAVWGGIGGFDGRGGLGKGIMYCVDKLWWDRWAGFVGWEWNHQDQSRSSTPRSRNKPHDLSSERLLNRSSSHFLGGSLGSYELMKESLKKDVDYVLVPPCVWDILYELYAGGPPLPRMIVKRSTDGASSIDSTKEKLDKPIRIPKSLQVETHPWIIECHVCDPHQPYRRGDVGPMSIRLMATPKQPLWRLFAEIVLRLPIVHPRGKDSVGKGHGRLWKTIDDEDLSSEDDEAPSRYGLWELLMKVGDAEFPVGENLDLNHDTYDDFVQSWEEYGDKASIESVGLKDGSRLMFEYSLQGKDGKLTWPREAAAKAGMKQRDSEEDLGFRRMLRGLGPDGSLISDMKIIIGTVVDAMDSAGRWYQAEIADVDFNKNNSDDSETNSDTEDEDYYEGGRPGEIRAVKIDFRDIGGHEEWINVGSDRLAIKDRFTLDSMKSIRLEEMENNSNGKSNGESKLGFVLRRHTAKEPVPFQLNNNKVCSFPGFGACGLSNLGNTCYANSAMQCISYLPLLRSYLLSGQFSKHGDINRDNPLGTGGKLLEEVSSLQQLIWSGKNGVRSPLKFRVQLGKALQQYAGAEQQDAQELLNDLLDALHEDSNKVVKKPIVEGLEDEWAESSDLSRVGEESWRRFLRRNRSIVANIAMGQVLNRVTCLTCNYTNRKFDPFNMLSIPFPSVSDVAFKCHLLRRASPLNCPKSLGGMQTKTKSLGGRSPSEQMITEEHTITVSRLADITDLKQKFADLSGMSVDVLKFFVLEDHNDGTEDQSDGMMHLTAFPEKEGPCLSLARPTNPGDFLSPSNIPTPVMVFECSLHRRSAVVKENDSKDSKIDLATDVYNEIARENVKCYGDADECSLYDTDPSQLAQASSRSQWPDFVKDMLPGLRVDAIDHRGNWFPGTVVEVTNTNGSQPSTSTENSDEKSKIKVHFDNFSSKWDLIYSIADFSKGNLQPLYSKSGSKYKLLELQVFHSTADEPENLFGYPFVVVCYPDWSLARTGAHIIAQAARYVEAQASVPSNENRSIISKAIDCLVQADRDYVKESFFANANDEIFDGSSNIERFEKKFLSISSKLPFDLFVCDTKQSLEDEIEGDNIYNYSLDKNIGNHVNASNGILLRWKKLGRFSSILFTDPFQNIRKKDISTHKISQPDMNEQGGKINRGMRLGVCLDEFCKEQNLGEDSCWRCPKCKDLREGRQSMALWRLPDLLTFHLKRFNCSARWREKITTKIDFPLTGLNMKEWCDNDSPLSSDANCIYDLIGVVHHYGGMTGGHYVANCKVTACSPEGNEEVEHNFNGAGVHAFGTKEKVAQTATWKLGRNKEKDITNVHTRAALSRARTAAESSEPLWLQFDDDSVEPIPPRIVNAESAYVLFYRRRQISPSSISRYSAMD